MTGCTEGGSLGDIYAYLVKSGTAAVSQRGGVYRYDQNGVLQEVIPVGIYLPGFTTDPTAQNAALQIRLNNGDIYLVFNDSVGNPTRHQYGMVVKVAGALPHTVTILHNFEGNSFGDKWPSAITFDSSNNVYVRMATASENMNVVYKLHPTTGAVLQRWTMPIVGSRARVNGWLWLTDNDRTLLYNVAGVSPAFPAQIVKRYDLISDTALSDWFVISGPYDTADHATFGQDEFEFVDEGGVVLTPDSKLIVPTELHFIIGAHPDLDGVVGYRGPGGQIYRAFAGGRDEGQDVDLDPDGVSVWINTEVTDLGTGAPIDGLNHGLYRFNINTGVRTKTLFLFDELGGGYGRNGYTEYPFCICGGQGGHGNPPPDVLAPGLSRFNASTAVQEFFVRT